VRVAVNARLLASPDVRGWTRYTVNLLRALAREGVDVLPYTDRPVHPLHAEQLGGVVGATRCPPAMRYVRWEQAWLPRQCRLDGVDVLHCPFHFGLPWRSPCATVLTLHDAIDVEADRAKGRSWRQAELRSRVHRTLARSVADRVVTVSEHARGRIAELCRIGGDRLRVVPEAADPFFHERPDPLDVDRRIARLGLRRGFVLYAGGMERRKNVGFLVEAFGRWRPADADLVLAGSQRDADPAVEAAVGRLGLQGRVHRPGVVSDADLRALYAAALCFVHPSRAEGFGLQLCEAMAAACPTLAARSSSLPEVLGSGGSTFGLDDPAELAALLGRIGGEAGFREDLVERARRRARDHSWTRAARETLDVYEEALRQRSCASRGRGGATSVPAPEGGLP
jgi:glycosyltransferase involved in cell wall biosynthesis